MSHAKLCELPELGCVPRADALSYSFVFSIKYHIKLCVVDCESLSHQQAVTRAPSEARPTKTCPFITSDSLYSFQRVSEGLRRWLHKREDLSSSPNTDTVL